MSSEISETRWAMSLGINAGRTLTQTEDALFRIQATGAVSDFQTIVELREARLQLNKLARRISVIIGELERAQNGG